jgi:hypothetical protein
LQALRQTRGEVGGSVGGGFELDPAGAVFRELQAGFNLHQQPHVALFADQINDLLEGCIDDELAFGQGEGLTALHGRATHGGGWCHAQGAMDHAATATACRCATGGGWRAWL